MPRQDPRVDAYIAKSAEFARPILIKLRKLFLKASPKIEETIKWGVPAFEYQGLVGMIAAFKQHASFGFWKQNLMSDPARLFNKDRGPSMSGVRVTSVQALPDDAVLLAYIHEAIDLNERQVKAMRKSTRTKDVEIPADLQKALRGSKRARVTFEALSPSHRKEYIQWITEAKRDETRQRRVQQAVEMLNEGKSRNWKYK